MFGVSLKSKCKCKILKFLSCVMVKSVRMKSSGKFNAGNLEKFAKVCVGRVKILDSESTLKNI